MDRHLDAVSGQLLEMGYDSRVQGSSPVAESRGDVVERFRSLPVANVSDGMSRMTAGGSSLRPMHGSGVLAGPAVTVKSRPGDNLMIHKALDLAEPGDVIVVDAGGDLTNALIGELMIAYAKKKGVAGIVIHGAVRDAASIRAGSFPVFAAGVTHRGPYKDGPGEINVPIAPFDQCDRVYQAAKAKTDAEQLQMANIAAGTNDRSWVDAALKRLNCEIVE